MTTPEPASRRPRPTVLVDTTEFQTYPLLDGAGWPKLLARSKRGELQIAVSVVTIREAERQVSDRLDKAIERLSDLDRFGVDSSAQGGLLEEARLACIRYREQVVRRIESAGGEVLQLPSLGLEQVLDRDLSARKPFNRDGKGFRDTLIWVSFARFLAGSADDDAPIFLLTGNKSDFSEGGLHPDLAGDVAPEVCERTSVIAGMDKLHKLLDDYFRDDDVARVGLLVTEREVEFETPTLREIIRTALPGSADDLVGRAVVDRVIDGSGRTTGIDLGGLMPYEVTSAYISGATVDESSCDFDVIEEYDGATFLIAASVDVELTIDGMIEKADYYILDDDDLSVTDWDVNDHVMSVEFTRSLRATFNLTVVGSSVEDSDLDYVTDISSTVKRGWFVTFTDGMYETANFPDGHYATAIAKVESVRAGAARLEWLDDAEMPPTVRITVLEASHLRRARDGIVVRTPNDGLRTLHGGTVVSSGWNYHPIDPRPWVRIQFAELDGAQRRRFEFEAHASAASEL